MCWRAEFQNMPRGLRGHTEKARACFAYPISRLSTARMTNKKRCSRPRPYTGCLLWRKHPCI